MSAASEEALVSAWMMEGVYCRQRLIANQSQGASRGAVCRSLIAALVPYLTQQDEQPAIERKATVLDLSSPRLSRLGTLVGALPAIKSTVKENPEGEMDVPDLMLPSSDRTLNHGTRSSRTLSCFLSRAQAFRFLYQVRLPNLVPNGQAC